jgi:glycosyltransferase involved in cell wall biosynthesis
MSSGTPVISTASGGPAEFLRDGENSLVVPVQDPEAIADAMKRIVADRSLRLRLSEHGRRLIEDRFNLDRYIADLDDWLQHSVIGRPRSPNSNLPQRKVRV